MAYISDREAHRLGLDSEITRRDFFNGALVGSGAALLGMSAPAMSAGSGMPGAVASTGYARTGDYTRSNGNPWEARESAHLICDGKVDAMLEGVIEIRETYDVLAAGGCLTARRIDEACLAAIPPRNSAVTIARLQKPSARELFSGAFVAFVWATEDGGSMQLADNRFDGLAQVLAGTAPLIGADGIVRQFTVGESYVVPRRYSGTRTLTSGYRHIILVEAKQLHAGSGRIQ